MAKKRIVYWVIIALAVLLVLIPSFFSDMFKKNQADAACVSLKLGISGDNTGCVSNCCSGGTISSVCLGVNQYGQCTGTRISLCAQ